MKGQSVVISALATYKHWKIDNGYNNPHTYDTLSDQFKKDNKDVAFIVGKILNSKQHYERNLFSYNVCFNICRLFG